MPIAGFSIASSGCQPGAIRCYMTDGCCGLGEGCFVYKRAAVVGRLGDNTAHIRTGVRADDSLHAVLELPSAAVTVVAHTRWESVGRPSASKAHPVDNAVPNGAPNLSRSREVVRVEFEVAVPCLMPAFG
jgi:hypothetical protein